jgi:hypothetical protein
MFQGSQLYIVPGVGASATYHQHKRNYWTGDAVFQIPHATHFIYTRGPLDLPSGDTTSATWHGNRYESLVSITLGFQRTFNRRQRSREWYWKLASGLGIDRQRFKADVTYKYSGEQSHEDVSWHETLVPFLFGGGRIWHLDHADLALELSGMIPCYSVTDRDLLPTWDYSLALTFYYRWQI